MGAKPSRRTLAEQADRTTRTLERDTIASLRPLFRQPAKYGNLVIDLDDADSTQQDFSDTIEASLSRSEWATLKNLSDLTHTTPGEDAIQLTRWARHRIVYTIDPDTAAAIIATDWSDTVIPGDVLRRLPHPDPLIILPEPITWMSTDGTLERYEAFGVFGVRGPRRRCSSHHPDATHLVLHFFGHICDPVTGQPAVASVPAADGSSHTVRPIVGMRAITPLTDATMTTRQQIAITDMRNAGPSAMYGFATRSEADDGIARMTETGLAILTYLVSDDIDTRRTIVPTSPKRRTRNQPDPDQTPAHVYEVGYTVGAALRAAHHTGTGTPPTPDGTGRTVAPHIRRAHLHTFRRGPGHSERFIKWLPPIPVATGGASPARTQVHLP
jgi:hypothetical protein